QLAFDLHPSRLLVEATDAHPGDGHTVGDQIASRMVVQVHTHGQHHQHCNADRHRDRRTNTPTGGGNAHVGGRDAHRETLIWSSLRPAGRTPIPRIVPSAGGGNQALPAQPYACCLARRYSFTTISVSSLAEGSAVRV